MAINEEKPRPLGSRVYKRHRKIIKSMARQLDVSEAEVVRRAIEQLSS
jgi:hypothetical protein